MSAVDPAITVYRIALSGIDCQGFYLTADADTRQVRMLHLASSDTLQKWYVRLVFMANFTTAVVITNEQTGTALKRNGVKAPIELVTWHDDSSDADFLWCQQPAPDDNDNKGFVVLTDPYGKVALDAALHDHCKATDAPMTYGLNRSNNQYWQFQAV